LDGEKHRVQPQDIGTADNYDCKEKPLMPFAERLVSGEARKA